MWQNAIDVSLKLPRPTSDPTPDWRIRLAATFLRKMSMHSRLSTAECERLLAMPGRARRLSGRTVIIEERETAREACVLIEGHAFRHKTLADGSRQILSFHLPGDVIDLNSTLLSVADHGITALTDVVIAPLAHEDIVAAMVAHPGIARAFWRETLVDGAIFREWLLNIGRRDAFGRLAHLLCETALRSSAAGVGRASRFEFPVTQTELADATAMTAVHVNRTLQRLRGEGLVAMHGGEVRIQKWDALVEAAEFDRTYLHLPASIAA